LTNDNIKAKHSIVKGEMNSITLNKYILLGLDSAVVMLKKRLVFGGGVGIFLKLI
jgi:hypothetical protein